MPLGCLAEPSGRGPEQDAAGRTLAAHCTGQGQRGGGQCRMRTTGRVLVLRDRGTDMVGMSRLNTLALAEQTTCSGALTTSSVLTKQTMRGSHQAEALLVCCMHVLVCCMHVRRVHMHAHCRNLFQPDKQCGTADPVII